MKLDTVNCTIGEQNHRKTFALAPSAHSIDPSQTPNLPNPIANRNGFYGFDFSYDLKVFAHREVVA
jgi:hypothetical protein